MRRSPRFRPMVLVGLATILLGCAACDAGAHAGDDTAPPVPPAAPAPPPVAPGSTGPKVPAPTAPVRTTHDRTAAVVAALSDEAGRNAKAGPLGVKGDALADRYVRTAAAASDGDATACLVGLAYVFDELATLTRLASTREAVRDLESDAARTERRAALGAPAMRARNDWLLHFTVSAALTALLGDRIAGAAGLAKEISDMKGASGFSFCDLLADQAGIVFAQWLLGPSGTANLAAVAKSFEGTHFLPDAGDLEDVLTESQWKAAYGGLRDARFLKREGQVREKVAAAYAEPDK